MQDVVQSNNDLRKQTEELRETVDNKILKISELEETVKKGDIKYEDLKTLSDEQAKNICDVKGKHDELVSQLQKEYLDKEKRLQELLEKSEIKIKENEKTILELQNEVSKKKNV